MPRWEGVRKATEFGPACLQPKPQLSNIYTRDPMPMSEDCLTLNIWTPINARNAPVFFWIYGGALVGGASREPFYDGTRLANKASSSFRSTIDWVSSAGSRIPNSAPSRRLAYPAIMACWIRSRRCAGSSTTLAPSAAILPT